MVTYIIYIFSNILDHRRSPIYQVRAHPSLRQQCVFVPVYYINSPFAQVRSTLPNGRNMEQENFKAQIIERKKGMDERQPEFNVTQDEDVDRRTLENKVSKQNQRTINI